MTSQGPVPQATVRTEGDGVNPPSKHATPSMKTKMRKQEPKVTTSAGTVKE